MSGAQSDSFSRKMMTGSTARSRTLDDEEGQPACFGRCYKGPACCGCVPRYRFQKKFDCIIFSLFVTMVIGLVLGVVTPIIVNRLVNNEIKREVVIDSEDAESYESWQTNTVGSGADTKIYYDVYIFDYQNVPELLNGSKPVLIERGPYHFNELFNKFDISWQKDGNEVTFNTQKYYTFDQSGTGAGLSLDDELTIPYVTVIGFEWLLKSLPNGTNELIEQGLHAKVFGPIEANLTAIIKDNQNPLPVRIKAQQVLTLIETLETVNQHSPSPFTC